MKRIVIAVLVAVGATTSAEEAYLTTGNKPWDACANKAIQKATDQAVKEGICKSAGGCWGAGGRGMFEIGLEACGPLPEPKAMPSSLANGCAVERDVWDALESSDRDFLVLYGDAYTKKLKKECKRIYDLPASVRTRTEREAAAKATRDEFRVTRVYSPAEGYTTVVIQTDRLRRVKCATVKGGEYQAVTESSITPPVDEVIIQSDGDSARCWQMPK